MLVLKLSHSCFGLYWGLPTDLLIFLFVFCSCVQCLLSLLCWEDVFFSALYLEFENGKKEALFLLRSVQCVSMFLSMKWPRKQRVPLFGNFTDLIKKFKNILKVRFILT